MYLEAKTNSYSLELICREVIANKKMKLSKTNQAIFSIY